MKQSVKLAVIMNTVSCEPTISHADVAQGTTFCFKVRVEIINLRFKYNRYAAICIFFVSNLYLVLVCKRIRQI